MLNMINMNKRIFYLVIMWIWNITFLSSTFYLLLNRSIGDGLGFFFLSIVIQFGLLMIFFLIKLAIDDDVEPDTYCPFLVGFFTLGRKKIYYSDLGYFWIRQSKNKIIVSKQDWFSTKKLFTVRIYDDLNIESIRKEIKSELEEIYQDELKESRKKQMIKDWDGYIDITSRRDDVINKIIK
jgi:hypothetical protein